ATVFTAGLDWKLLTRANTANGTAEIWTARAEGLMSNVTVRASLANQGTPMSLTVMTFAGSGGVGASATASGAIGAPTVALATTASGSLVYGTGNDWDGGVSRLAGTRQAMIHEFVLPDPGDTFWVQQYIDPIESAGHLVTLTDTEPTDHHWNFAAVEILPVGARVPRVSASPSSVVAGEPIVATVVNGPGNPGDSVALFDVNAASGAAIEWKYLNGS